MKWWTKDFWKLEPMDEVEQTVFGFLTLIIFGTVILVTVISVMVRV